MICSVLVNLLLNLGALDMTLMQNVCGNSADLSLAQAGGLEMCWGDHLPIKMAHRQHRTLCWAPRVTSAAY